MIYKKSLSPLISTILLISISITIVSIMTIMSSELVDESANQIDSSKKDISCQQIYVEVKEIQDRDMVCIKDDELNIFIQNIGYDTYYGIITDILFKDFTINTLTKYENTEIYSAQNKLIKYNISSINVSNINELEIRIGLKDSKKNLYFCPLEFSIPNYRLIDCNELYNN